ncbi:MAG: hypothetical protein JRC68_08055 [Deltaproteobacteria bacterium]|nr:hypothetical protein [Deltaproteobacteria bacterium]
MNLDQDEPYRFEAFLEDQDLSLRSLRIRDFRVDLLICGAVSRALYRMLTATGIEVIPDISGRIEEILEAYLKGSLGSMIWTNKHYILRVV